MSEAERTLLRAEFGEAQVLWGEAALPFETDWRRQFPGRALAVLRPRGVPELQAMLRSAARLGLAVVPQGGNTGLVGGSTPDASGRELLLSLTRLDRVRALEPLNLSVCADAGCRLATLQQLAAERGLLFPLSLASEGSATLGGVLATNAGGTQVLRWGNARALCLGLEVVTAEGALMSDLDGLHKDHRGLALRELFIGSEGCLGVITGAVMRLDVAPRSRQAAWLSVSSMDDVLALLQAVRGSLGAALSGFELMGQAVQALLSPLPLPAAPWAVLLELSSTDDEAPARERLQAALADAQALWQEAVLSESLAQFQALWRLRESIPEAQTRAGGNLKHDISLQLQQLAAFVPAMQAELQARWPGCRPMVFGHAGDGNLHYNVAPPVGEPLAHFRARAGDALTLAVFEAVRAHGGSFSAEHGIGRLRLAELARWGDATALELMRRVKQALDPANRLNPGRRLPP